MISKLKIFVQIFVRRSYTLTNIAPMAFISTQIKLEKPDEISVPFTKARIVLAEH